MEKLEFKISGYNLLQSNPQTVDPFNSFAKAKKTITNKKKKTEEDLLNLQELEVRSKIYWDDEMGAYIPTTWLMAALASNSWNKAKIKKADIRASVFPEEMYLKLYYEGMNRVEKIEDISRDNFFIQSMLLKQGQVKIAKSSPIFHNWYFQGALEFDSEIIDKSTLVYLLEYASKYGGFGDFRPTYGRAKFEDLDSIRNVA